MKIILFSFLFFVTFLPSALACRCPPRGRSGTIQQSYYARSTRAVFRAKVVSISGPCQTCTFRNQGQKRTFSLEIEQIYKGCPPSPTAITVQSFIRPPFCDFSLSTGSVYLFSTPQGIVPTIGSCNIIREWESVTAGDRQFLNSRTVCCDGSCACISGVSQVNCFVSPCAVTSPPCEEAVRCENNFCGGCFTDWFTAFGSPACIRR